MTTVIIIKIKKCKHKDTIVFTTPTSKRYEYICKKCGEYFEGHIKPIGPNELEKYIAEQLVKDVIKDMENLYLDDKPPKPPKRRVKNDNKKMANEYLGKQQTGTIYKEDVEKNKLNKLQEQQQEWLIRFNDIMQRNNKILSDEALTTWNNIFASFVDNENKNNEPEYHSDFMKG